MFNQFFIQIRVSFFFFLVPVLFHKVFIVRVRADFFKPRDVSFHPVPNTVTKVVICCL